MFSTGRLILLLVSLALLLPYTSMAGVVDLPRTGQTTCFDSGGTEIPCAGTGQDGDIKAGISWPNPRFTVGSGAEADCVTDNLTGLMWMRSPDLNLRQWQQAIDYANNLSLCGYTDWHLPNVNELETMIHGGQYYIAAWLNSQGFSNIQQDRYWSSTTSNILTTDAWNVSMYNGLIYTGGKTYFYFYAWPVRTAAQPGITSVPKTGQKTSYAAGDDGDLETGTAWPDPRFTVSGDCVTDNLTGLTWVKSPGTVWYTWQAAIDYANGLVLCGYDDWRLPNYREMHSLSDYSRSNPALPSGHPFLNIQSNNYWTSTTHMSTNVTSEALAHEMYGGGLVAINKSVATNRYVLPVRGGTGIKTLFQEDDAAITYTGTWNNYTCVPCSGGALKYSNQTGAKADFSFNGTGIKWIVTKANLLGKTRVYLDGVNMGLVDLYNPTAKYQVVLLKTGLASGTHTVTIEVSGQKNAASAGYFIDIDAFEFVP